MKSKNTSETVIKLEKKNEELKYTLLRLQIVLHTRKMYRSHSFTKLQRRLTIGSTVAGLRTHSGT